MISSSAYMSRSFAQPLAYYIEQLLVYSPLHLIGLGTLLIPATTTVIPFMHRIYHCYRENRTLALSCQVSWNKLLLLVLTYPIVYIGSMTLLGNISSGFQLRFLLPVLPIMAVISSFIIVRHNLSLPSIALILVYNSFYMIYYGVLYAPLFADFEGHIVDILRVMIDNPFQSTLGRNKIAEILDFMRHFGVVRTV